MTRGSVYGLLALGVIVLLASTAASQRRWRRGPSSEIDRRGVPDWEFDPQFAGEAFTFVRLQYDSYGRRSRGGYYRYGSWATDWPDSDLNFSFRLQQLTSIRVNPKPIYLSLRDEELFDHPFLYLIEPGHGFYMTDEEVGNLRRYLDNGGFLMVDDFWGEQEWNHFYQQIKRVYPDREPVELPLEHPIFHIVYDLKEKPQVPSIHSWAGSGLSYERYDAEEVHYRAIFDDAGRMVSIICHNTDLGDGWEREGENEEYFHMYSEKQAYPMGINIVVYAMTH